MSKNLSRPEPTLVERCCAEAAIYHNPSYAKNRKLTGDLLIAAAERIVELELLVSQVEALPEPWRNTTSIMTPEVEILLSMNARHTLRRCADELDAILHGRKDV